MGWMSACADITGLINARLLEISLLIYRRLLPLRRFEINAAMMTPAAVISGGSNFSINSVIMQSRVVSNCGLRLSTKYGRVDVVRYRSIRSIHSITAFLSDSAVIPGFAGKSGDWCGESWDSCQIDADGSGTAPDAR
jgi:hypothetical protein